MNVSSSTSARARNGGASRAKAGMRYFLHRENDQGERQYREAFSHDQESLSKGQVYERLDQALESCRGKHDTYYYTVVLNPGDRKLLTPEQQREWVTDALNHLKGSIEADGRNRADWVAVLHNDQGNHDHAHGVLMSSRSLRGGEVQQWNRELDRVYDQCRELHFSRSLQHDQVGDDFRDRLRERELQQERQKQRSLDWDM